MGSAAETASPPSSWQSPVPYLFCGLAAMLMLIAFALLLLGCSYWKLYRSRDDGDLEADGGVSVKAAPPVVELEEKYVVIMAGQEKPTFLAAPTSTYINIGSGTSETSLALHKTI